MTSFFSSMHFNFPCILLWIKEYCLTYLLNLLLTTVYFINSACDYMKLCNIFVALLYLLRFLSININPINFSIFVKYSLCLDLTCKLTVFPGHFYNLNLHLTLNLMHIISKVNYILTWILYFLKLSYCFIAIIC